MAGQIIGPGNPSNIIPPQTGHGHNPANIGPHHIPQAAYPFVRIPLRLPWSKPSTGIRV